MPPETRKPIVCALLLALGIPAAASELGKLAESLPPGSWAELQTEGFFVDGVNILTRCSHSLLAFNNELSWDATAKQGYILGSGHGEWASGGCVGFVKYDDATNRWSTLEKPPFYAGMPHAWDHTAYLPEEKTLYHLLFGGSGVRQMFKYDMTTGQWTEAPALRDALITCCLGLEYFPEMNALITYREPYKFDLAGQKWSALKNPFSHENNDAYGNFAEYNPVQKAMIMGGGGGSRLMYKLDAAGTITKLKDAPMSTGMGSTRTVEMADSRTGQFLIFDILGLAMYEYDLGRDSWKPAPQPAPLTRGGDDGNWTNIVGGYVETYGVAMVVQWLGDKSKVVLYKPTGSAAIVRSQDKARAGTPPGIRIRRGIGSRSLRLETGLVSGGSILTLSDLRGRVMAKWRVGQAEENTAFSVEWEGVGAMSRILVARLQTPDGRVMATKAMPIF